MKRGLAFSLWLVLALAAPLPEFYDRLEGALGQVRIEAQTQALPALERAQSLLRQEGEALPPVLRDAALLNLQEARQALLRKSQADLEARLLLVRHLLGKALMDGFLAAKREERDAFLGRLARATGLPQALVQEVRSLSPAEARRRLEAYYLQAMAEDLGRALGAGSRPEAYLALARAYARYLVIQDSPQSTLRAQEFVQALAKVSGGEPFRTEVAALREKALAWRKNLQIGPKPQIAAPSSPQTQAPKASSPPPPATPSTPPSSLPLPTEDLPKGLREEVSFLRVDPEVQAKIGKVLETLGYPSLVEWLPTLDEVRSAVAQAQVYTQAGQGERARLYLNYAYNRYRLKVMPLVESYAPDVASRLDRFFQHLSAAPALRTVDLTVLLAEVQEAEEQLFGDTLGFWHTLQTNLVLLFAGIPRAVFFLLVGVLAFFPLYLIRLTFGGRNLYWNLLVLASFFLFLPIIAEGLSYFGSLMASYGGLPWLSLLTYLSIGEGLVPYIVWVWFSAFLAVALATAGLRGIAAQFGLLKERGAEVAPTAERPPSTTLTSETIVEWDEEF